MPWSVLEINDFQELCEFIEDRKMGTVMIQHDAVKKKLMNQPQLCFTGMLFLALNIIAIANYIMIHYIQNMAIEKNNINVLVNVKLKKKLFVSVTPMIINMFMPHPRPQQPPPMMMPPQMMRPPMMRPPMMRK